MILLYLILLVLTGIAFTYVRKMKGCECTDPQIVQNLYYFETYFLIIYTISICLSLFKINIMPKKMSLQLLKNIGNSLSIKALVFSVAAAYFVALSYFINLVYKHNLYIEKCKCADINMKHALYIQAFMYSISVISSGLIMLTVILTI